MTAWWDRWKIPSSDTLSPDSDESPSSEGGFTLYNATLDRVPVRAGIAFGAFGRLMVRAGLVADRDLGEAMIGDMLPLLQPTIEAYLQAKHFNTGADNPLLIDSRDLLTHRAGAQRDTDSIEMHR